MRPKTSPLLCALAVLAAPEAGWCSPGDGGPGPVLARYVASGGEVYQWDGASPKVARPTPPGDLPGTEAILALEPYAGGRQFLLLQENPSPGGKERNRREGLAITFDAGGTSPRRLHSIPFEGRPFGDAITPDGGRAYVLARRPSPGDGPGAERYWVHEIDLPEGRLLGSVRLPSAPAGIAVQPDGRRVFVALADRIQTFTTDPLIGSWHYRSPGPNRDLVVRAGDGTVCVSRGDVVALFDPAAIAARSGLERHARIDDASTVIPLPFEARRLDLSEDGRLAAVWGPDRMAFLDCATQSLIWPAEPPSGLAGAGDVRTLAFPAAGRDLVLALFPAGDVVGFRTPAPPPLAIPPSPSGTPASPSTASPVVAGPEPAATQEPEPAATPRPDVPSPAGPTDASTGPSPADPVEHLSGRITGDRARVAAIVLYGPNSIVREFGRTVPDADGVWRVPLPPPGTYRLVPAGEGSTPLPATPVFLTVRVESGGGRSGLDFEIGGRS